MATAIPGFTPTTPPTTTSSTSTGLNAMTGSDFLKLMIQQLQEQDPLNPTDSNQLLTQMSQISTLQSNTTMEQSLQGLTLQQSIGAGGNLIGKNVQGLDVNGNPIGGVVTSVKVQANQVLLELDSASELPMQNVTQIAVPAPTTPAASATSSSAISQLLAALGVK